MKIESSVYFSWEQYFAEFLEAITKDSRYCKYSKAKLADFYMEDANAAKVLEILNKLKFNDDNAL